MQSNGNLVLEGKLLPKTTWLVSSCVCMSSWGSCPQVQLSFDQSKMYLSQWTFRWSWYIHDRGKINDTWSHHNPLSRLWFSKYTILKFVLGPKKQYYFLSWSNTWSNVYLLKCEDVLSHLKKKSAMQTMPNKYFVMDRKLPLIRWSLLIL